MPFALPTTALELLIGAFIGCCIGLTGVGGGVLVLPALTAVLGLSPSMAVGTASTYVALTRVQATWAHHKLRTIDWRAGNLLLAGALPGTFFAALYVKSHTQEPDFQQALGWVITGAIVTSGLLMGLKIFRDHRAPPQNRAAEESIDRRPLSAPQIALRLLAGLGTGVLIASTSVGGGVILIPILLFLFRLPIVGSVGTSNYVGLVLAGLATAVYLFGQGPSQVALGTALTMWVGSLIGVRFGSRLTTRLSPQVLQALILGIILVSVLLMGSKLATT